MIRALFFDIDGTLVSHTSSDIPADTLDALYRLRDKGILLFLATGRHLREVSQLPLHGFPFDGYVTQTGQLCYDGDFRPICEDPLDAADTAQAGAYAAHISVRDRLGNELLSTDGGAVLLEPGI